VWSRVAVRRTIRAMLVMPTLFAITYKGFGNLQMALFAGFGSFATPVMATFAGTWRDKLIAYAGLTLAGSALLVIGTAVSSSTALAALVAVPATFTVLFAGGVAVRGASPTTRTPRPDQSSPLSGREPAEHAAGGPTSARGRDEMRSDRTRMKGIPG
jgi:hypothetical protein